MDSDIQGLVLQTEQALQAFYHGSTGPDERQSAHKCLMEIQNSTKAWQICWQLLDASKSVEFQYFGACMLHHKITRFWKELPQDHYMNLKDEMIKFLAISAKGAKMVVSKLCTAMAAFILQVIPEYWPDGCQSIINEIQSNNSLSLQESRYVTLEYLTVLPEEFNSAIVTGPKRTAVREKLEGLVPKVLEMLHFILNSTEAASIHSTALKCLSSWVQFGASLFDCQKLLPIILNKLNDASLIEVTSSVLVELLSHPTSFKQENSVYAFLEQLDGFEIILKKALEDEDLETVTNICKILVAIGETHTNLIRQASTEKQQKHCLQLVNLILRCTDIKGSYPVDETCSELTFSFWYTFQDELLTVNPENVTNYHYYLRESFVALIQILFRKVQIPDESLYADYAPEEKEMLRCYRQDIQDTIMYVYSLLREQCLQNLTELFKFLLSGEKDSKWQEIEAVLYLLQGTSDFVESNESHYIQTIISLLPVLPSHPKVLESAVYMIGSFSEWLACHPDQQASVLPLLLNGIHQNQLTAACTLSLRDICRESCRSFSSNISLDVVNTCLNACKSKHINDKEQLRCIESIGFVLAGLGSEVRQEHQKKITSFLINALQSTSKFSQLDPAGISSVQHAVGCFTAFFRSSDFNDEKPAIIHPLVPCYMEFIQVIQMIVCLDVTDGLAQEIMNAIHKATDTIRDSFMKMLPETSLVIFELFKKMPSGFILEVCATIIGMLGNVEEGRVIVKSFFERLVIDSINCLHGERGRDSPDIIHGFLVLLNRTIKSAPYLLFQNGELHIKAIQCALDALSCQETPTVKAATNLFTSYIGAAATGNQGTEMLDLFGQDLITRVLACIGGLSPRSNVDLFADILLAFNRHFITKVAQWLQHCIVKEGFPSQFVTNAQKDNFKKTIIREKVNKRKLKEIVREFSLVCRGLHGMAYTT